MTTRTFSLSYAHEKRKGIVSNTMKFEKSSIDLPGLEFYNQSINKNYFIVRPKVDQKAGQLSLPHVGITKTEKNRTET